MGVATTTFFGFIAVGSWLLGLKDSNCYKFIIAVIRYFGYDCLIKLEFPN